MPRQIRVYRDGCATWLEVDDWVMPADWIDSVTVDITVGDGPDVVMVTLRADHISVDAKDTPCACPGEVNGDGEEDETEAWPDAVRQEAPGTTGEQLCLSRSA